MPPWWPNAPLGPHEKPVILCAQSADIPSLSFPILPHPSLLSLELPLNATAKSKDRVGKFSSSVAVFPFAWFGLITFDPWRILVKDRKKQAGVHELQCLRIHEASPPLELPTYDILWLWHVIVIVIAAFVRILNRTIKIMRNQENSSGNCNSFQWYYQWYYQWYQYLQKFSRHTRCWRWWRCWPRGHFAAPAILLVCTILFILVLKKVSYGFNIF